MEANYVNHNDSNPVAYITSGKGRLKINQSNKVYLKDKQNFEIELFNPTQEKVMAKITLNGSNPSSRGIILRPGERVFLDRHLDTPDKFQFSTYKVEDNSPSVEKAIKNNGSVQIDFYKEKINNNLYNGSITITPNKFAYPWGTTLTPTIGNSYEGWAICNTNNSLDSAYSTTLGYTSNNTCTTYNASNCTYTYPGYNSLVGNINCSTGEFSKQFKETGTIEKGKKSDQEFDEVYYNFEYYSFYTVVYQILPISEFPININDLNKEKIYCPSCGQKVIKKGYKYCPSCGYKMSITPP